MKPARLRNVWETGLSPKPYSWKFWQAIPAGVWLYSCTSAHDLHMVPF